MSPAGTMLAPPLAIGATVLVCTARYAGLARLEALDRDRAAIRDTHGIRRQWLHVDSLIAWPAAGSRPDPEGRTP